MHESKFKFILQLDVKIVLRNSSLESGMVVFH